MAGFTPVSPTTIYAPATGYGFEAGATLKAEQRTGGDALSGDALSGDGVSSDKPFLFSVALPEGNYNVKITLGGGSAASITTVKAEQRRLMLEAVPTQAGATQTRTFPVNVHQPAISKGREVGLKPGEKGPPLAANWDDKLTLEFNGKNPGVAALEITPAPDALTIFVAGDSTVTDQKNESYCAWGQMLPRFLAPGVAVANYAESGLTLSSFKAQRRLEKILSQLKTGDYVFIQFGHNDQKDKFEGAGPFTSYKSNLKAYVAAAREKGGLPVVVAPMERRRWSNGQPQETLTDFAQAVRQVSAEAKVPLVDLHAMSLQFYAALGDGGTKRAFVFFAANSFPGQTTALGDNTHFNNYGAYELARGVVEGIKANVPELAKRLATDVKPFDPSQPDAAESFGVPLSVFGATETPDGS